MLSNLSRFLAFAAISVLFQAAVVAQTQRGQINGRVTDSTGAVVPGAKVEVTNPAIGVKTQTETNAEGLYTVPYLQYGRYNLAVAAQGFAPYTVTAVEVATATTTTVNATLALATLTDQVTVQAGAVDLETSTTIVGTGIEEKLKSDMPNLVSGAMRSAFSYIYLSPGVNWRGMDSPQATIAGGRTFAMEALIDGQTVSLQSNVEGGGVGGGGGAFGAGGGMPSVEAIGEYRMLSNSMTAEYGRSTGGMMTFATKSGTNMYHGAAYEYMRNEKLDARPWQAAKRDPLKQNEFGFAGGGPVILPKIYNGTNKTFVWATLTGYKLRTIAASKVLTLPTAAMRQGNFSAADINPIYDSTNLYTDASGQTLRRQFSYGGTPNVIDPTRLSPVSKYFLDKLPLPNLPGSVSNFVGTSRNTSDNWDFTVKGDQYLSSKSRISGFYQFSHPKSGIGSVVGDLFGAQTYSYIHRPRLDWTYNLKPNLINQVLYGFTRYSDSAQSNNYGQNIGQAAGIRGTYDPNCPEIWFPGPDWYICGNTALGGHPVDQHGNLISTFNDSLMWNRGAHTLKAGVQIIRFAENFRIYGSTTHNSATGEYSFQAAGTANTNGTGGDQWASFFLGYPSAVTMYAPAILGVRQTYYAAFVQDDWKVSRRLTINAGLRWDVDVPYSEVNGKITLVDLNRPNPGAGNLLGALSFYGSGPGRNGQDSPGKTHWKMLRPRLGLAYQIDSKTVFRAFAGLLDQGAENGLGVGVDRTGFQGGGSPLPNSNPYGLYYSWDTPYPQNVLGTVPNTDPSFRNGQSATTSDASGIARSPENYMWSGGFQREVKGNIVLEATYFANNHKHGYVSTNRGELDPKYWSLGSVLNLPLNSPQVQALGFTAPYPGFDVTLPLYRALRPYPQFNGLNDTAGHWGGSTYQAGIFKAQKRFSSGLTFLANYTISKYIVTAEAWSPPGGSFRSPNNYNLDRTVQRYDTPQRLVLGYSYELPFGPGKRFGSGTGRLGKQLLGGWTVSGIHQYTGGIPLGVSGSLATAIPTVGSRADRVLGVPVRSSVSCSEMQFGNPAKNYLANAGNPTQAAKTGRPLAYQSEGAYGFGNMPAIDPQARQCGTMNEDVSINKSFFVWERLQLRFGADMFNILNRHTWQSYTMTGQSITAADFGQITPFQVNGPRLVQLKLRVEF
ncbi:MAG: TonB-dependent receptor [Bryobacteraceae bacterium]|jgi:hypothetical protein